jgi:HSP20 family molecular chaperone IbpA
MFEKRKCLNCDRKLKDEWKFCPYCGEDLEEEQNNMFDIDKEMDIFEPFKTKGEGIRIIIQGGSEPRIERKSSSDYRRIEPEFKTKIEPRKMPKITEEPEAKIQNMGRGKVITIDLPGVKADDVEVKRLEQSVEIKAYSKDKAYFKLIPVPANSSVNKEFRNGVLKIEVRQ